MMVFKHTRIGLVTLGLVVLLSQGSVWATVVTSPGFFSDDFEHPTQSQPYWSASGDGSTVIEDSRLELHTNSGSYNSMEADFDFAAAGFSGVPIDGAASELHTRSYNKNLDTYTKINWVYSFETGTVELELFRGSSQELNLEVYVNSVKKYDGFGASGWSTWNVGLDITNAGKTIRVISHQNDYETWDLEAHPEFIRYEETFAGAAVSGELTGISFVLEGTGGSAKTREGRVYTMQIEAIPEPTTLGLLAAGGVLGLLRRKR